MHIALPLRSFAFVLLLASTSTIASAAEAQPLPKPPELKVLDRLIGNWEFISHLKVLGGEPADVKITGTTTRQWILDGRVVEERGKSEKEETRTLFSYDVNRSQYRMWYFSSAGYIVDGEGNWDEASKTFNWSKDFGNGLVQSGTIHFIDDNTQEWTSSVKDAAGKVHFEGGGKLTRKK